MTNARFRLHDISEKLNSGTKTGVMDERMPHHILTAESVKKNKNNAKTLKVRLILPSF